MDGRARAGGFGVVGAALAAAFLFLAALFGRIDSLWLRVPLIVAGTALAVYVAGAPRRTQLREYFRAEPPDEQVPPPAEPPASFEDLVEAALEALPADLRSSMSNVEVVIEDEPPPGMPLLGLYQGLPLTQRTSRGWLLPDKITIYRGPLERHYGYDPLLLEREVKRVVLHEVAHHFGISDARLVELDRY